MLENLSKKDLEYLKEMLEKDPDFLTKKIREKSEIRMEKKLDIRNYYVTRTAPFIKDIDEKTKEKGNELLLSLEMSRFPFFNKCMMKRGLYFLNLLWSFDDFKALSMANGIFSKDSLSWAGFYNVATYNKVLMEFMLQKHWNCVNALQCLEIFFEKKENILIYEDIYNTFRYVKNHIYTVVLKDNTIEENYKLFWSEKIEKEELVKRDFLEIAKYLYQEVNCLENARLATFNNCLSRWLKKKEGTKFTFEQNNFIDMVSTCSTKEELEQKDYKKVRELIYVPQKIKDC